MKEIIQKYYCNKKINVIGPLRDDIEKGNERALRYVGYVIKDLLNTKGVEELLKDIAEINISGKEGKRIYYNSIMQLHAIYFAHSTLKLQILEVESKTNKVLSPYRKKSNKSCDIRAKDSAREYYFESKDASAEIMTSYKLKKGYYFCPMSEEDIQNWIIRKTKEADEKGANYLICRVPVWVPNVGKTEDEFYDTWIRKIFEIKEQVSRNAFIIALPCQLSPSFEGIYIIKSFGHLRLQFKHSYT